MDVAVYVAPGGFPLQQQHTGDAGYDVCAAESADIAPGMCQLIGTGIYMEIQQGYECQVRPRSGLAVKHQVTVINSPGTIDAAYRGECKVGLINHGSEPFHVERGDRIAQFVFATVPETMVTYVQSPDDLGVTQRGNGGFGSTGVRVINE